MIHLEPATCLVHVFAFIPANDVNESIRKDIITYILGRGFPEPTVEHRIPQGIMLYSVPLIRSCACPHSPFLPSAQ